MKRANLRFLFALSWIVFFMQNINAICQTQNRDERPRIGMISGIDYCIKSYHIPFLMYMQFGGHQLQLGPEYGAILEPLGDPVDYYRRDNFGIDLGYQYYFRPLEKSVNIFGQLAFKLLFLEHTIDPIGSSPQTNRFAVLQNTLCMGISIKCTDRISTTTGAGLGSNRGFFLIQDPAIFYSFFRIEIRLNPGQ